MTSRRLVLTPVGAGDAADIVTLHRDPRVLAHLIDGIPDEDWRAQIYLDWAAVLHRRGIGPWAARRDGRFVGLFTLTPFVEGDDSRLELGGRLSPTAWSGDLAVEAGARLITHAFDDLGHDVLMSTHHPNNPTVPTVLARLGFVPDGPVTVFGHAALAHRLSADTWRAQNGTPLRRTPGVPT
jgi:RimJ/RimL family protein N-acetyltransferase